MPPHSSVRRKPLRKNPAGKGPTFKLLAGGRVLHVPSGRTYPSLAAYRSARPSLIPKGNGVAIGQPLPRTPRSRPLLERPPAGEPSEALLQRLRKKRKQGK